MANNDKYSLINKYLLDNANSVQKLATALHKKFLGAKRFRTEYIQRYQENHIKIVKDLANNLKITDLKRGTALFNKLGEDFGRQAIADNLTIEEAVDGTIFLKQAIWEKLKKEGLLKDFSSEEMYNVNQAVGTYCDVMASKIAFAYHQHFKKKQEDEKQHLYSLFMQAPIPIAILKGPNHVYELSNPLNDKGLEAKDVIGKPIREVFPDVKKQGILSLLDQVYRTGKPYYGRELPLEVNVPKKGKTTKYINFTYQPLRNSRHKIEGIMVVANDVTNMVVARKRIEEAEEKFRMLADNMPNLAWMAHPDGNIFWYNSRWYEYTGTTPKQMEKTGWQMVQDPIRLTSIINDWKRSLKSGEPFDMVLALRGEDGIFRPFLTRVVPIKNEKGKITRWFGTNTDITKQKELEKQKDEFLAIASHELKTPVTSIKAYGQVLHTVFTRKGDVRSAELLLKMDIQINKLTTLIGDLLDVTKIHAGRLRFRKEYFDFNELVHEVAEELQRTTEKHAFIEKLSKTRTIYGDRERVGQVISNLISNAIKYSPKSNKIIIESDSDKTGVTLCIQDFGIGIAKEKQDHVFEQFFRVSGDHEITFPGLGLGLYVSSEIIKREGGRIWVESIKGKGSTFCFFLPIVKKSNNKIENTRKGGKIHE